jgi:hypothetical protein
MVALAVTPFEPIRLYICVVVPEKVGSGVKVKLPSASMTKVPPVSGKVPGLLISSSSILSS